MLREVVSGSIVSRRDTEPGPYQDGVAAAMIGDNTTAYDLLYPLAERGDPFAQDDIGVMYAKGYGVDADPKLAAQWFSRAAEQGHSCGQYHLALCYQEGQGVPQDHVLAYAWFNLAAATEPDAGLRGTFVEARRNIENLLNANQISEAQSITRAWKPKTEQ